MAEPEMERVDSTSVDAVGYDADAREIHVRFKSGRTYAYARADRVTFERLRDADSVGRYLNRVVKPRLPVRPL